MLFVGGYLIGALSVMFILGLCAVAGDADDRAEEVMRQLKGGDP